MPSWPFDTKKPNVARMDLRFPARRQVEACPRLPPPERPPAKRRASPSGARHHPEKMLTHQLRELEHDGIVIRTVHLEVPSKVVYTIDPGEEKPLRVLTTAMCEWANYWALRTGATITHPVLGSR